MCVHIALPGESCASGEFCADGAICAPGLDACVCQVGWKVRNGKCRKGKKLRKRGEERGGRRRTGRRNEGGKAEEKGLGRRESEKASKLMVTLGEVRLARDVA